MDNTDRRIFCNTVIAEILEKLIESLPREKTHSQHLKVSELFKKAAEFQEYVDSFLKNDTLISKPDNTNLQTAIGNGNTQILKNG